MKNRFLVVLTVLLALTCALVGTAAAETTLPETCPQCGEAVTWTGVSELDAAAETLAAGHYYVDCEEASYAFTAVKSVSEKVCLYLPAGKTLTGPNRVFTVASTGELSVMGEGTLAGIGYTEKANGGTVYLSGGKLNILGGILTTQLAEGNTVFSGGVIYAAGGTIKMSGGSVQDGKTHSDMSGTNGANGGNILLTSSAKLIMTGGTIKDGTITGNKYGSGGNIYVNSGCTVDVSGGSITGGTAMVSGGGNINTRGLVKVSGTAVIDGVRPSPTSSSSVAATFNIYGTFTGSVRLRLTDSYIAADYVIGTIAEDADISNGTISACNLKDAAVTDYYIERKGTEMVLTSNTKEAYCEACGSNQTWTRMTEGSASATSLAAGHYYLSFTNGTADWAEKEITGKVCLDLNGMKIQGIKRVFRVENGGELSIIANGGTITSGGFASTATNAQSNGGVAYIYAGGKMNVYGGSYKSGLYESTNRNAYQGGIFWTQGELNLYNATLDGTSTQVGKSIFVQSGTTSNGNVTISGGKVTGDVYVKGYLTLENQPQVAEITLKNPRLHVKGVLTGEIQVTVSLSEATADGLEIGTCENAMFKYADFWVVGYKTSLYINAKDDKLVLSKFQQAYPYNMERRYCEACDKECDFAEITDTAIFGSELATGHYYLNLTDPSSVFNSYMILGRDRVCLDLNGQDWVCDELAFDLRANTILNVMDSVGGGSIVGGGQKNVNSPFGGTFMVRAAATLNLYSGTLTYAAPTDGRNSISRGGVVYALGTVNIYGGTVTGGQAGAGGNIYIDADSSSVGHIGLYGGTVTEGTGTGSSILSRGTVLLSGNPEIYQIRRTASSYSPAQGDMLEIRDDFTGSVQFYMPSWKNGLDIGYATNADISNATITFNNDTVERLLIQNGEVYAVKGEVAAIVHNADGSTAAYTDVAAAITAYDNSEKLVLNTDVADLELTKDLTIDLNGHSITGAITGSGALTLLDSQTDDFDITDGVYGKIPVAYKDSVQAAEGYLMAEEADGMSFHKIVLNIRSMSLKTKSVGVYFVSEFKGDSLVKEQVKNFGVLLSVEGDPVSVMGTGIVEATKFGKEAFNGGTAQTSTLVYGIMKDANGDAKNQEYAAMQIYGRPYVKLEDGTVLYGTCRNRSLKEQVEAADAGWNKLTIAQKASFMDLYNNFKSVITAEGSAWTTTNSTARVNRVDQFNTIDYTPYLAPWNENVVEKAIADGKIHYYFMAGEGLHISDTQTYKDKWGDACLIVFPNGKTMLVDAGPLSYTPVLVQNLENMGITHLDYFLLTHPHSDHQNGIFYDSAVIGCGLLDKFPVGQIFYRGGYDCDYDRDTDTATLALRIANQYGIPIQPIAKGDVFDFDGVRMEVIWPLAGDGDNLISGGEEINSMSITMRFDYGEHSSLFTGDLYVAGEMNILEKVDVSLLKADFMKVPHHGYNTSSCAAFLNAVDPDLAVSTGRLPIPTKVYDRYADLGIELLDDRQKGYIHVSADAEGVMTYETTRESFGGDDTIPDTGEDPVPDEDGVE